MNFLDINTIEKIFDTYYTPSKLISYKQCPFKFYLKYVLKFPSVEDKAWTSIGKNIHKAIEEYYRIWIKEYIRDPSIEFRSILTKYGITPEQDETIERIIDNFIKFEEMRLNQGRWSYNPIFVEQLLIHNPFIGIIDVAFRDIETNEIIIIDWKTGFITKTGELKEEHVIQGLIYKYLVENTIGKVSKVYFMFLRFGKLIELPKKYDYTYLTKVINEIEETKKKRNWIKKKGVHCNFCEMKYICELVEKKLYRPELFIFKII